MRRFRSVLAVVVFGLAGALVGVAPGGVSAVAARSRCRATAFVTNSASGTVSTIDVKTRSKDPTDIAVGSLPLGVAVTPDGKTAFVANNGSGSVSTIDVKTRTKNPADIGVGRNPRSVAVTPDGKTAFVTNASFGAEPFPRGNSVSKIDVKTRTKDPGDITVGPLPAGVAFTPDGKTAFVTKAVSDSVSMVDVKTENNLADIAVGSLPTGVAVTPDGKTAFVTNHGSGTVSTIDVKTRTKNPNDIAVSPEPFGVAITPCRR
jgi:YVTN family beta-propeller protein